MGAIVCPPHVTLDLSHRLTKMKFEIFLCVRQLVHLFVEKCKSGIICSVFKIFFTELGTHVTLDLSHRLAKISYFPTVLVEGTEYRILVHILLKGTKYRILVHIHLKVTTCSILVCIQNKVF